MPQQPAFWQVVELHLGTQGPAMLHHELSWERTNLEARLRGLQRMLGPGHVGIWNMKGLKLVLSQTLLEPVLCLLGLL